MAENAKPRDLQAGWAVFRKSRYEADLEEINAKLQTNGFGKVSPRAYTHYKKLHRFGYERYVPINQLDVETLRDPVWDTPLRHRYLARSTDLSVILVFILKDLIVIRGDMASLSELEAEVIIRGSHAEQWTASPAQIEHAHGLILVGDSDNARSIVVEEVQRGEKSKTTVLRLGFLEVVAPDRITSWQPLPMATLTLVVHIDDSEYLLNIVRTLNGLVSAIESVRIACDEALRQLGMAGQYSLAPPEVLTLRRENPLHLVIQGPEVAIGVFVWLVSEVLKLRQHWHDGSVTRGEARINEATAKLGIEKAKLVGQQAAVIEQYARRETIKNDVLERLVTENFKSVATIVMHEVRGSLRALDTGNSSKDVSVQATPDGDAEPDTERLETLLQRQVFPSLEKMLDSPLLDIEYSTDVTIPTEVLWPDETVAKPKATSRPSENEPKHS